MGKLLVLTFRRSFVMRRGAQTPAQVALRATWGAVAMHIGHISFSAFSAVTVSFIELQRILFRVRTIRQCASVGAAVPSDQLDTGIMNTVSGSGAP